MISFVCVCVCVFTENVVQNKQKATFLWLDNKQMIELFVSVA